MSNNNEKLGDKRDILIQEILSHGKYKVMADGSIINLNFNRTGIEKTVSMRKTKKGYLTCCLFTERKKYGLKAPKSITCYVHRVVAFSFFGQHPEHRQINHKNGDKTDNRISNIEWCSASENISHAFNILNRPTGLGSVKKLKLDGYKHEIHRLLREGKSKTYIARKIGCSFNTVKLWIDRNISHG